MDFKQYSVLCVYLYQRLLLSCNWYFVPSDETRLLSHHTCALHVSCASNKSEKNLCFVYARKDFFHFDFFNKNESLGQSTMRNMKHKPSCFFMTNAVPTDFLFHSATAAEFQTFSSSSRFSCWICCLKSNHTQTQVFVMTLLMINFLFCLQNQATMSAQHVKPNTVPLGDWCNTSSTRMAWKFMLNHQTLTSNSKIKQSPQQPRRRLQATISVAAHRVQQVPQTVPANLCNSNNNNSRIFHRLVCVTIHYYHHLIYILIRLDYCECHCHRHCLKVN